MSGPRDTQLVVRMPRALLEAIKAHQRTLQAARPFENVSVATAARDLLARGLAASKPRSK